MKQPVQDSEYTVRVPPEVDRVLRQRAEATQQSLDQVIVDELRKATVGDERKSSDKKVSFMEFVGRWTPDPEFDAIIEEQRRINWDMWK
jgi:hypothetical protein